MIANNQLDEREHLKQSHSIDCDEDSITIKPDSNSESSKFLSNIQSSNQELSYSNPENQLLRDRSQSYNYQAFPNVFNERGPAYNNSVSMPNFNCGSYNNHQSVQQQNHRHSMRPIRNSYGLDESRSLDNPDSSNEAQCGYGHCENRVHSGGGGYGHRNYRSRHYSHPPNTYRGNYLPQNTRVFMNSDNNSGRSNHCNGFDKSLHVPEFSDVKRENFTRSLNAENGGSHGDDLFTAHAPAYTSTRNNDSGVSLFRGPISLIPNRNFPSNNNNCDVISMPPRPTGNNGGGDASEVPSQIFNSLENFPSLSSTVHSKNTTTTKQKCETHPKVALSNQYQQQSCHNPNQFNDLNIQQQHQHQQQQQQQHHTSFLFQQELEHQRQKEFDSSTDQQLMNLHFPLQQKQQQHQQQQQHLCKMHAQQQALQQASQHQLNSELQQALTQQFQQKRQQPANQTSNPHIFWQRSQQQPANHQPHQQHQNYHQPFQQNIQRNFPQIQQQMNLQQQHHQQQQQQQQQQQIYQQQFQQKLLQQQLHQQQLLQQQQQHLQQQQMFQQQQQQRYQGDWQRHWPQQQQQQQHLQMQRQQQLHHLHLQQLHQQQLQQNPYLKYQNHQQQQQQQQHHILQQQQNGQYHSLQQHFTSGGQPNQPIVQQPLIQQHPTNQQTLELAKDPAASQNQHTQSSKQHEVQQNLEVTPTKQQENTERSYTVAFADLLKKHADNEHCFGRRNQPSTKKNLTKHSSNSKQACQQKKSKKSPPHQNHQATSMKTKAKIKLPEEYPELPQKKKDKSLTDTQAQKEKDKLSVTDVQQPKEAKQRHISPVKFKDSECQTQPVNWRDLLFGKMLDKSQQTDDQRPFSRVQTLHNELTYTQNCILQKKRVEDDIIQQSQQPQSAIKRPSPQPPQKLKLYPKSPELSHLFPRKPILHTFASPYTQVTYQLQQPQPLPQPQSPPLLQIQQEKKSSQQQDTYSTKAQSSDLPESGDHQPKKQPIFEMRNEDFPALTSMNFQKPLNSDNNNIKTPEKKQPIIDDKDVRTFLASYEKHHKVEKAKEQHKRNSSSTSSTHKPKRPPIKVWPNGMVTNIPSTMLTDQYGMAGLYAAIKGAETNPHVAHMLYGMDLESLGLDLRSKDPILPNFKGPFYGEDLRTFDTLNSDAMKGLSKPKKRMPDMGILLNNEVREGLEPPDMEILSIEDLFYMFYTRVQDILQLQAADELYNRGWAYYIKESIWITRDSEATYEQRGPYERGHYICYDHVEAKCIYRYMRIDTTQIDSRPIVPRIKHENDNLNTSLNTDDSS